MSMFEARRDVQKQLQDKFPTMKERDAEVLADMTVKFGEDLNDLLKRTLETFSPLLDDIDASMLAPVCLADGAMQLGIHWKQTTIGCIRELREMVDACRTDGSGADGLVKFVMERLRKLRGE